MLTAAFLLVSCSDLEFNNPDDPESKNYIGNGLSSSSAGAPLSSVATVPSSSSSSVSSQVPSSGSKPSSSSGATQKSSSSVPPQSSKIEGDPVIYEGETYPTVIIGEQVWMAKNLNYAVEGSKCGGDDGKLKDENTSYCDTYGRLYNWATAMNLPSSCNSTSCASQVGTKHRGICPEGWHIPSNADWNALMKFVNPNCSDNSSCAGAGTKLKATSGWNSYSGVPAGTDEFGFSALPGCFGYSDDRFDPVGSNGSWWSASERSSDGAYNRSMHYYHEDVGYYEYDVKSSLFSVRCVKG